MNTWENTNGIRWILKNINPCLDESLFFIVHWGRRLEMQLACYLDLCLIRGEKQWTAALGRIVRYLKGIGIQRSTLHWTWIIPPSSELRRWKPNAKECWMHCKLKIDRARHQQFVECCCEFVTCDFELTCDPPPNLKLFFSLARSSRLEKSKDFVCWMKQDYDSS